MSTAHRHELRRSVRLRLRACGARRVAFVWGGYEIGSRCRFTVWPRDNYHDHRTLPAQFRMSLIASPALGACLGPLSLWITPHRGVPHHCRSPLPSLFHEGTLKRCTSFSGSPLFSCPYLSSFSYVRSTRLCLHCCGFAAQRRSWRPIVIERHACGPWCRAETHGPCPVNFAGPVVPPREPRPQVSPLDRIPNDNHLAVVLCCHLLLLPEKAGHVPVANDLIEIEVHMLFRRPGFMPSARCQH